MPKENLETKARKAVLKIEEKITDITNILYDISSKLCYLIKDKRSYQDMLEGNDYSGLMDKSGHFI